MPDFPDTLDAITPDWLSTVLDAPVRDVRVLKTHHGTTGRARLAVDYTGDADTDTLPATLFAKLPPPDARQREFVTATGMGWREARFYAALSDTVPVRVPHCRFAATDETGEHFLMLLEDLTASGCTFRRITEPCPVGTVPTVIDALARLHGMYLNSPSLDRALAWIRPPALHPMGPALVDRALEQHRDAQPPVFAEAARLYTEHAAAVHDVWRRGMPTLAHGDVHDGNLFDDHGEPGFLDWALLCRTTGLRDVAGFLVGSVSPDDRRQHQRDWLARYRDGLRAAGARDVPASDTLWREYRWHALYTWVAAASTLAMGGQWQPSEAVHTALTRAQTALEDLDSVAAVRAALDA